MENKILILEDEKEVGQLYLKSLKDHGYDPVLACDGLEGIKLLKTVTPDLILLDLGMPNMNGIEFYQYICDSKGKPSHPVLVLTGRTDLETLFKDFNVEGFIIKPFKREQLLNEVDIVFNKKQQKKAQDNAKKVVIIDNDLSAAEKIRDEMVKAGYKAEIAMSGMMGIETVMAEPPDLAVVSLNLLDLPGDLVILRLKTMAKTKDVSYVLYVQKKNTMDKIVAENIAQKSGVKLMCEYVNPVEIAEAATKVFKGTEE